MTWVRRIACGAALAAALAAGIAGTAVIASAAAPHVTVAHSTSPSASPQPASPKATTAPQPAGSSFPWSNLITAVSTLAAGLGGILLKDRLDVKRGRGQRRRDAYAGFLVSLDELNRVIGHPGTLQNLPPTLGQAIGQAVGSVQRAYAPVYLTAPAGIQGLAEKVHTTAWDIQRLLDAPPADPGSRLFMLREELISAANDFVKAVRKGSELTSRAPRVGQHHLGITANNRSSIHRKLGGPPPHRLAPRAPNAWERRGRTTCRSGDELARARGLPQRPAGLRRRLPGLPPLPCGLDRRAIHARALRQQAARSRPNCSAPCRTGTPWWSG